MGSFLGKIFISSSKVENFSSNLLEGNGISIFAEKQSNGSILYGIEADFFRQRIGSANSQKILPGANGIGGFVFVAPSIQIKRIEAK